MAPCSEPFPLAEDLGAWLLTAARSGWRIQIPTQPRRSRSTGRFSPPLAPAQDNRANQRDSVPILEIESYVEDDSSDSSRSTRLGLDVCVRLGAEWGRQFNQESQANRHFALV